MLKVANETKTIQQLVDDGKKGERMKKVKINTKR